MTLQHDIQSLAPQVLIELFELDASPITRNPLDVYRFCDGVSTAMQPIRWQGQVYQPWPVQAQGYGKNLKGTLPRPKLVASNLSGMLSVLCSQYDDLIGAKLTRKRTYGCYLDGQPQADPTQQFDDEVFYIERKVSQEREAITWELASALDLSGVQLPGRVIRAGACNAAYRDGDTCQYAQPRYFDVRNQPVDSAALDVCAKTLAACKVRFGAGNDLPFGGFPSARAYRF